MNAVIDNGSRVTFHYRLKLKDGNELESSFGAEPLTLVVGEGELAPALEFLLQGLKTGDHESYEVGGEQAVFGYPDEESVQDIALSDFPADIPVEAGTLYGFSTPAGDEVAGVVREIKGESAQVDFNHPLIGHDFMFEVEILDVEPPAEVATASDTK